MRDLADPPAAGASFEDGYHRLRALFEQAPGFVAALRGPDHVYEFVNNTYAALVGHREVLGRTVAEALPEVVEQGFIGLLDNVYRTGEPFIGRSVPVQLQHVPGGPVTEVYVDLIYQAVRDADGAISGIFAQGHDVTDTVRALQAQQQSEARYRLLFDSIDEGFCVVEMIRDEQGHPIDYRFLTTNRVFEAQSGLTHATGQRMRELVPDHEAFWFETFGEVARTGEPRRFASEAKGIGRWFDVYAFPADGDTVGVLFRDITASRLAEHVLTQVAARDAFRVALSDALRLLSDPIDVQEAACRILGEHLSATRVNYFAIDGDDYVVERDCTTAGAVPLRGRYPVRSFGQKLLDAYRRGRPVIEPDVAADPDLTPEEKDAFAAIQIGAYVGVPLLKEGHLVAGLSVHQQTPRAWTAEEVALIEETADRTWSAYARAKSETALRESYSLLEDRVTQRTEQLRVTNETLVHRNRELQDFAYVASHDLQEPLRKITTFASMVVDDEGAALSENSRHALGRMQAAAERMSSLIRDLLSFSRVASKGSPLATIDLDAVLAASLSDLDVRLAETGGTVEAEPLGTVLGDASQLQQVFTNLIGNALKFTRPGVLPRVQVRREDLDGQVTLVVEDNGVGFDAQHTERIFAPFQRLHSRAEYEGTGIGLAIVRKIAERHGGDATATSTPGEGSRFAVTLANRPLVP